MNYQNLDKTESFAKLQSVKASDFKHELTKDKIKNSNIPVGGGLTYNYAALPVNKQILSVLQQLCGEQELIAKYKSLLSGDVINLGEKRSVLHQHLRGSFKGIKVTVDGEDKDAFYESQLKSIKDFSEKIRNGTLKGSTGKPFTTICQIGIGGSDLGPRALYLALEGYCSGQDIMQLDGKFISNVDPDDAAEVLGSLNPETTLFVLVSKSGTTLETLTNQLLVGKMVEKCNIKGFDLTKHFVAVTSKTSPLAASKDMRAAFFIDDYIGGRYSATSMVGAVMLSCTFGFDIFRELLDGAHENDILSLESDITKNAAMLSAAVNVYMRNVLNLPAMAVIPYSQALSRFPAHLQQLAMESNGKHVNRFGEPVNYSTQPVIFGEPGTNGQHSFFQLLHQGTDITPVNFIGFSENQRGQDEVVKGTTSQKKLIANLTAQIVAMLKGKNDSNPNKQFEGNRYSSLVYGKQLTPEALGALLALYENSVMFEGFLWNVNSFDQEGVQLGKVLATKILENKNDDEALDAYLSLF